MWKHKQVNLSLCVCTVYTSRVFCSVGLAKPILSSVIIFIINRQLGCLNVLEVKFNDNVQPVFCKRRRVLLALESDLEEAYGEGIAKGVLGVDSVFFINTGLLLFLLENCICQKKRSLSCMYAEIIRRQDAEYHKNGLQNLLLRCRIEKCQFAKLFVEYFGLVLLTEGIAKGPKVDAVIKIEQLSDVSGLKAFLGSLPFERDADFDDEERQEDVEMVCPIKVINRNIMAVEGRSLVKELIKDPVIFKVMRFTREGWNW
ncbi:unnamed protein product [Lepeophtheirus salmonis]|uniref:(salmon louse) hypothetical protein n=1 Tax=Lepeophtheirus salmonis TaxID=72036 RepID=A0A7R8CWC8_LEPSM|nr:unnamed protein product [Lepeophtheirus salmonis]CAF2921096.1 unnamed protein product [Lepeophtheirus salmonis]